MIRSLMYKFGIAFLLAGILFLQSCGQSPGDVNPEKSDQWELVTEVEAHHDQISERFSTKGQPIMITYKAESTKEWTHCNFTVTLVEGQEEIYDSPIIAHLNHDSISGKKWINPEGQSYYLRLKVLEMHSHVRVYRKKAPDPTKAT